MGPIPFSISVPALKRLITKGESKTLELKRSTGELREAMQTICAFANGEGGHVIIGAKPAGQLVGQQVSEQTLHDVAAARDRFEPPVQFEIDTVKLAPGTSAIVLSVSGVKDSVPFTYDGRAYERIGNTTRKMAQERYESLLFERTYSRRRWENQVADEITIKDIDREEVFRILKIIEAAGRLAGPSARSLPDALDRLGVRKGGELLRAAVVLFGKTFMPDYPQCELRMARFRGVTKAEFMDQRQLRGPAFQLLEEAQLFCQRHFPLPAKIVPTQLRRVETPLIPPDAMREILVNALIHHDYSIAGGAVSLAIFDDRVEVWSTGRFPNGITPEALKSDPFSVLRNPIIADVFHRTGLIEKWGRGTNRVAEMCEAAGIAPPEFKELTGGAVVTFRVPVAGASAESRVGSRVGSRVESFEERVLRELAAGALSKSELAARLGMKRVAGQLHRAIATLMKRSAIEFTIPERPGSRLQRYRLTATKGQQR